MKITEWSCFLDWTLIDTLLYNLPVSNFYNLPAHKLHEGGDIVSFSY